MTRTQLPPDELAALPVNEIAGSIVCELGNKQNSTGLYRDWYHDKGAGYMSVDWNGKDGALPIDMRNAGAWKQVAEGHRFKIVTNFGFTEHVGDNILEQLECWRNVHNLVAVDGWLSMCMPIMPHWKGHGRWMPTPQWYTEFASMNGYSVELSKIWDRVRPTCVLRLKKFEDVDFIAPPGIDSVARIERSDR